MNDSDTMKYNTGYDMKLKGYDKNSGTITKNDEKMINQYNNWIGAIKTFKKVEFIHTKLELKELVFCKENISKQLLIIKVMCFNKNK